MRVNRGEEINEDEEAKAREVAEAKAKKELADAVRLAAELRVQNQTSLTELARNWAVKLFDTSRMSGPEFEEWKAEGLDLFGDVGGEAADRAREVVTKPKDGYVTVRDDGKIIARHRGDEFVFTAGTTLPWVKSVSEVEFADLPDAIEADPGDIGFGTGDDPGDDDPSGFLEGMSRTAQSGGAVDPTVIPSEAETKNKLINRAERVKLSTGTRGEVGSVAENIGGIMDNTRRLIERGVDVKVGKVARPDLIVSPDLNLPSAPPPPVPQAGTAPTGPTISGPELDPAGDHATPKPWYATGPVHKSKKKKHEVTVLLSDIALIVLEMDDVLREGNLDVPTVLASGLVLSYAEKVIRELGIDGDFYEKIHNGKSYLIIKGRAGLREKLKGTRYLAQSPKVVGLGLGTLGKIRGVVKVNALLVFAYIAIDTLDFILKDEKDMAQYLGRLGADLAKALVLGGTVAVFAAGVAFFAIPAAILVGGAVVLSIGFSFGLNAYDDEHFEKYLAAKIEEALEGDPSDGFPSGVNLGKSP